MSTGIEWTEETWNPIRASVGERMGWHCERVSPGCQHCYAETQNVARRFDLGTGLGYTRPNRDLVQIEIDEATLEKPLHWRKPRRVFVCSMTDLFGEWVSDEMLDRVFAVMSLTPHITYQLLTKRPERQREYQAPRDRIARIMDAAEQQFGVEAETFIGNWIGGWSRPANIPDDGNPLNGSSPRWPLPNVWLGVSVEDQQRADERIPVLLETPAAVRFLSCEPLLGPLDFDRYHPEFGTHWLTGLDEHYPEEGRSIAIDWVIVGGESGAKARPCDIAWVRSIVSQCKAAGVAVFVKQMGKVVASTNDAGFEGDTPTSWPAGTKHNASASYQAAPLRVFLRHTHGGDPAEWPEDLRVREWPQVRARFAEIG